MIYTVYLQSFDQRESLACGGRYVPNARRGSSLHGATEPRLSDDNEGLQVLRDGELVQGEKPFLFFKIRFFSVEIGEVVQGTMVTLSGFGKDLTLLICLGQTLGKSVA